MYFLPNKIYPILTRCIIIALFLIAKPSFANDSSGGAIQEIAIDEEIYLTISENITQDVFDEHLESSSYTRPISFVSFESVAAQMKLDKLFETGVETIALINSPQILDSLVDQKFDSLLLAGGDLWQNLDDAKNLKVENLSIRNFNQMVELPNFEDSDFKSLALDTLPKLKNIEGVAELNLLALSIVDVGDFDTSFDVSPLENLELSRLKLSGFRPIKLEGLIPPTTKVLSLGFLPGSLEIEQSLKDSGELLSFQYAPTIVTPELFKHLNLTGLEVEDASNFEDLQVLTGMPLEYLRVDNAINLISIDALKNMKLKNFSLIYADRLRDIDVVSRFPLIKFSLQTSNSNIPIAPIRELQLVNIFGKNCYDVAVSEMISLKNGEQRYANIYCLTPHDARINRLQAERFLEAF